MKSSNDRQAVWQKNPIGLFFLRDGREIWRLLLAADGAPRGMATRWLVPPGRIRLAADSLDVSPTGDRLMLTFQTPASDIWLVEFDGK